MVYLASFGALLLILVASVQGEKYVYSKLMTPVWLYENAQFESPSVISSHDVKRLTLKSLVLYGRLFTVPLPSVKYFKADVVFKIRVSLQKPSGDSDLLVGIGNAQGYSASAFIVDNRPYTAPMGVVNSVSKHFQHTEVEGSSSLTGLYDEEITFIYKPSENFGAYHSGNTILTGVFNEGPDLDKNIYLVVNGHNPGEIYKIHYIHVEIMGV
jgi:hypothetical protein